MVSDAEQVAVVGAGIAGLAAAHRMAAAGIGVRVLEAEERPGGRMSTFELDVGPMERGAQFLSTGYTVVPELLSATSLTDQLVAASGRSGILVDGRVLRFDTSRPASLVRGGVLRMRDILPAVRGAARTRRLADRGIDDLRHWVDLDDVDGATWAVARFGAGLADRLLAPTVLGLYFLDLAGSSAALPGALVGFSARRARAMTLHGGLGRLTSALAARVDVEYGVRVERVARDGRDGAVLDTIRGRRRAAAVVMATPARSTAAILADPRPAELSVLDVPYSRGLLVGLALREPLATEELGGAYGILASPQEATALAAVAVRSRAGPDTPGELLTVMLRPSAADRWWSADDETVRAAAVAALAPLLPGLGDRLTDTRVVRWEQAMPSLPRGHARAVTAYRSGVSRADPVVLAGDYLGFPWTDSAAFNGRWAADQLLVRRDHPVVPTRSRPD